MPRKTEIGPENNPENNPNQEPLIEIIDYGNPHFGRQPEFSVYDDSKTAEAARQPEAVFEPDLVKAAEFIKDSIDRLGDANKTAGFLALSNYPDREKDVINQSFESSSDYQGALDFLDGTDANQRSRAESSFFNALRSLYGQIDVNDLTARNAFRFFKAEYGRVGKAVQAKRRSVKNQLDKIIKNPEDSHALPVDLHYDPTKPVFIDASLDNQPKWRVVSDSANKYLEEGSTDQTEPISVESFLENRLAKPGSSEVPRGIFKNFPDYTNNIYFSVLNNVKKSHPDISPEDAYNSTKNKTRAIIREYQVKAGQLSEAIAWVMTDLDVMQEAMSLSATSTLPDYGHKVDFKSIERLRDVLERLIPSSGTKNNPDVEKTDGINRVLKALFSSDIDEAMTTRRLLSTAFTEHKASLDSYYSNLSVTLGRYDGYPDKKLQAD